MGLLRYWRPGRSGNDTRSSDVGSITLAVNQVTESDIELDGTMAMHDGYEPVNVFLEDVDGELRGRIVDFRGTRDIGTTRTYGDPAFDQADEHTPLG
jgi:hypothetical protein